MAIISKNILPYGEYQIWTSANMQVGDILGVYETLGGAPAETVTLESPDGDSAVKFNVVRQVYREVGQVYCDNIAGTGINNNWAGQGAGVPASSDASSSPWLVGEIEETYMPRIIIKQGTAQTWSATEFEVIDIKIVIMSGLRITVT